VPSKLSDADKFDLQQYITRCYGSLTTFNILFKNKDDQFRTGAVDRPEAAEGGKFLAGEKRGRVQTFEIERCDDAIIS
jgi:hypothetical protein